jgi:hypothetical protein
MALAYSTTLRNAKLDAITTAVGASGFLRIDGNVGTSGSDLNLNTTSIVTAATVAVSSFTITAGNA